MKFFRKLKPCRNFLNKEKGQYNKKFFSGNDNLRKEEILFYIMNDKYSVKPDKEYRICHTTIDNYENTTNKIASRKKIIQYGKHSIKEISNLNIKIENAKKNLKRIFLKNIFPRDYPYSVKEGYAGFSKYTILSNVCHNTMSFISTQVLINSLNLNVNRAGAFALSAGLNWAIKEGVGQMGSIIFITKYIQKIEKNAKSWRIISITGGSLSLVLEVTPLVFPAYFLIIASVANIIKFICLSGNQISRTAVIEHFSKQNNIVDLSNKYGLQHNISILVGNFIGFLISCVFPFNNFVPTFALLSLISCINIYTAFKSVTFFTLCDFNFQRMCLFCEEYVNNGSIISTEDVKKREKIFYLKNRNLNFANTSPEFIIKNDNQLFIVHLFDLFKDKNYFVMPQNRFSFTKMKSEWKLYTFLRLNADNNDIFFAFLYSIRLNLLLNGEKGKKKNFSSDEVIDIMNKNQIVLDEIDRKVLIEKMKLAGWVLNFGVLEEKYNRYHMLFKSL